MVADPCCCLTCRRLLIELPLLLWSSPCHGLALRMSISTSLQNCTTRGPLNFAVRAGNPASWINDQASHKGVPEPLYLFIIMPSAFALLTVVEGRRRERARPP